MRGMKRKNTLSDNLIVGRLKGKKRQLLCVCLNPNLTLANILFTWLCPIAGVINHKPARSWMAEVLFLLAWSWQPGSSWVGANINKNNQKIPLQTAWLSPSLVLWSPFWSCYLEETRSFHLYFCFFLSFFSLECLPGLCLMALTLKLN